MKILNRYTGAVIYEDAAETMKETVENAVKAKADMSEADLSGANMSEANLSGANMSGADIRGANLSGRQPLITISLIPVHRRGQFSPVFLPSDLLFAGFQGVGKPDMKAPAYGRYQSGSVLRVVSEAEGRA